MNKFLFKNYDFEKLFDFVDDVKKMQGLDFLE